MGPRCEQVADVLDRFPDAEVGRVELELAGLHLGEVEDVVDDRHQRLAGATHGLRESLLLRRQAGVEQQLRHADHAVHRRADLVAHVGQELGLHARRLQRLVVRDDELLLRAAALDELPDVRRDRAKRSQQHVVRPLDLGAEELDDAHEAAIPDDRERKCAVEAHPPRSGRRGEARVGVDIGDPDGVVGRPHAADEALTGGEGGRVAPYCLHRRDRRPGRR